MLIMSGGFHFKGLRYIEWCTPISGIDYMPGEEKNAVIKIIACTRDTK